MDVSEAASWSEFAVAMAGVAAVLAGLVFVALSLNLKQILAVPGLAGRAGESVILFIAATLQCAFLLLPDQPDAALAGELLVTSILEGGLVLALAMAGLRLPSRQPRAWAVVRLAAGQLAALPVAVSAVLLLAHPHGALYCLAGAILWAIAAGTANAWVLLVEVVRDERYRPLEELPGL